MVALVRLTRGLVATSPTTISGELERLRTEATSRNDGEICAVDQTRWSLPLAVYVTLFNGQRILIVYAGDLDASNSLRRHLQRFSRRAALDGVPYRQYWGEPALPEAKLHDPAPTRYPVLRPEDEEEVERMFQRLKSVGRTDARNSEDK